ncbi:carboxylating nicotinate-nucleotide diphosphorylase [Desulfonatronum thioautotrophicum]|uniref:carboxylating nicotinate-nucleotide diphosphorylase n=1 Tax=Desulfonatronum thioautotrophicum TaxID=617001 RepID=UPI0005EB0E24|nr:carboxylating nicotinate-nucleotide diphosphorylase [Desulfonatronum thioautotrophicum]
MDDHSRFHSFFHGEALEYLDRLIRISLEEDGRDLTAEALFSETDRAEAVIRVKQDSRIVGLPIIAQVLKQLPGPVQVRYDVAEGQRITSGTYVARLHGQARSLLKAERVILNFIGRLSGIANLTEIFLQQIAGTGVRLLDTRKTTPGLRYPEKYAVFMGGGTNHRLNLSDMLMLKDNHIDRAGGITPAVRKLLAAYDPCPPIEVECRTLREVAEVIALPVQRIMLDNMTPEQIAQALAMIPKTMETEISGGVNLETIADLAALRPTFISVGALTHSAVCADISMSIDLTAGAADLSSPYQLQG